MADQYRGWCWSVCEDQSVHSLTNGGNYLHKPNHSVQNAEGLRQVETRYIHGNFIPFDLEKTIWVSTQVHSVMYEIPPPPPPSPPQADSSITSLYNFISIEDAIPVPRQAQLDKIIILVDCQ